MAELSLDAGGAAAVPACSGPDRGVRSGRSAGESATGTGRPRSPRPNRSGIRLVQRELAGQQRPGHGGGGDVMGRASGATPIVLDGRESARRGGPGPPQPPQLLQDRVQALARDELHDVVVQPVLLAHAEDRHDVGVVQPAPPPAPRGWKRASWRGSSRAWPGRTFSATCRPSDSCSAS